MKAAVFGSTGLVGAALLGELSAGAPGQQILAYARDPARLRELPGLRRVKLAADASGLEELAGVDTVFCCLGTTIKRAGSEAAFRAIDFGLSLRIAEAARAAGVGRFLLVTSQGADARSRVFYLRTKGELELAVEALGFSELAILRPSLLLGERGERRIGEEIAKGVSSLLPWSALPAAVCRYEPISGDAVARALWRLGTEGVNRSPRVLEADEIRELSRLGHGTRGP